MGTISQVISNKIDQALLQTHTAFLAEIKKISVIDCSADVQPLTLYKQKDGKTARPAIIKNIPIARHIAEQIKNDVSTVNDIALCVVCERDITDASKGKSKVPILGHHELKDCVLVATFKRRT